MRHSANDVAGALAAAIAAAMDTSTSVNDAVTGYNVDAATTAPYRHIDAGAACVAAAAAAVADAMGTVAEGAAPGAIDAGSAGVAAAAAAAADAAACGSPAGDAIGGFGGDSWRRCRCAVVAVFRWRCGW